MTGIFANQRAFAAAAVTVLLALVAIELTARSALSTDRLSEWSSDSFLAHERDDHGRLMSDVVRIGESDRPEGGRVIVIGGSTIREGLLPDPVVQAGLDTVLGNEAPAIHTLYSFDQSMVETARIATNLDLGPGDTVAIGINPRRLGFGEAAIDQEFSASRLALLDDSGLAEVLDDDRVGRARPSPGSISEAADELGERALFSPWAETEVFEQRLFVRQWVEGRLSGRTTQSWSHVWSGRWTEVDFRNLAELSFRDVRAPVRYGYGNQPLSDIEKQMLADVVADTRVDEWFDHHQLDLSIAEALIDQMTANGVRVVLLELPRTTLSVQAYAAVWESYDDSIDDLAARTGATRIDLRDLEFSDDDFFDLEHLLAQSRPRLTDAVFAAVIDTNLGLNDE